MAVEELKFPILHNSFANIINLFKVFILFEVLFSLTNSQQTLFLIFNFLYF